MFHCFVNSLQTIYIQSGQSTSRPSPGVMSHDNFAGCHYLGQELRHNLAGPTIYDIYIKGSITRVMSKTQLYRTPYYGSVNPNARFMAQHFKPQLWVIRQTIYFICLQHIQLSLKHLDNKDFFKKTLYS